MLRTTLYRDSSYGDMLRCCDEGYVSSCSIIERQLVISLGTVASSLATLVMKVKTAVEDFGCIGRVAMLLNKYKRFGAICCRPSERCAVHSPVGCHSETAPPRTRYVSSSSGACYSMELVPPQGRRQSSISSVRLVLLQ